MVVTVYRQSPTDPINMLEWRPRQMLLSLEMRQKDTLFDPVILSADLAIICDGDEVQHSV